MLGTEMQEQQREGAQTVSLDQSAVPTLGSPARLLANSGCKTSRPRAYPTQKQLLTPKAGLERSHRANGYSVPGRTHRNFKKRSAVGVLQKLYHEQHADCIRLVAEYTNAKERLREQDRRVQSELCAKKINIEDETLDISKVFSVPQRKRRSHAQAPRPLKAVANIVPEEEKGGGDLVPHRKEESEEPAVRHSRMRDALLCGDTYKPSKEECPVKTALKGDPELEPPEAGNVFNDGSWRDKYVDRYLDLPHDLDAVSYVPPSFAQLFDN